MQIKLGDAAAIDLSGQGDLGKLLKPDPGVIFSLSGEFSTDAPLKDLPDGSLETGFTASEAGKWDLSGVNLTLSVKPTAAGTITITKAGGKLFSRRDGVDPDHVQPTTAPAGVVYVSLKLQVGITVAGGASFSSGHFGVKGSASDSETFTVTNHIPFPESAPAREAIAEAFRSFVLPFKADGIETLTDGSYVDYTFNGRLGFSVGFNYGFTGILAGRSSDEVQAAFDNAILAKAVLKSKPSLDAGVSVTAGYTHEDSFRVIVERHRNGIDGVSLYLLRDSTREAKAAIEAGFKESVNATFDLSSDADGLLARAAHEVIQHLPSEAQPGATAALSQQLQGAKAGAVADINKKVNGWLGNLDGKKAGLAVELSQTQRDTTLFRYDFDFRRPEAQSRGFQAAMRGDYCEAIRVSGVTLDAGSFIENSFTQRAALTLQFFDLWKWTDTTTYFTKVDSVYAGNGIFRLQAKVGVIHESGTDGHQDRCEVYFSADAVKDLNTGAITGMSVILNFVLRDQKRKGEAAKTLKLLRLMDGDFGTALVRLASLDLAHTTLAVSCAMDKSAYGAIGSNDEANYRAFLDAVAVSEGPNAIPQVCKPFGNWARYNIAVTDRDGGSGPPNRREFGSRQWPSSMTNEASGAEQTFAPQYFEGCQRFMNFCEDLHNMATVKDEAMTEHQYKLLLDTLEGMVKLDASTLFTKPSLLALMRVSGAAASQVSLTLPTDEDTPASLSFRAAAAAFASAGGQG